MGNGIALGKILDVLAHKWIHFSMNASQFLEIIFDSFFFPFHISILQLENYPTSSCCH